MNNKQEIIEDLKEMIYKLQIECAEKTDNILALGEKCNQLQKENEVLKIKERVLKSNRLDMFEHLDIVQENKQLKKENEELKDKLNCRFCYPIMKIDNPENFKLCQETDCFRRQIERLKKENETLDKVNADLMKIIEGKEKLNEKAVKLYNHYRQTLEEIKEIALPIKENTCFGMHCGMINEILQKINEVENVQNNKI